MDFFIESRHDFSRLSIFKHLQMEGRKKRPSSLRLDVIKRGCLFGSDMMEERVISQSAEISIKSDIYPHGWWMAKLERKLLI